MSGMVGLGKADWLHELVKPRSMGPAKEPDSKGPLTLENAAIGKDWSAMELDFSEEASKEFIAQKQRTDNPLFFAKNAIAHPSWTAGWAEKLPWPAQPTRLHPERSADRRSSVGSSAREP